MIKSLLLALLLTGCAAEVGGTKDKDNQISALSAENAALKVKLSTASEDLKSCDRYQRRAQ